MDEGIFKKVLAEINKQSINIDWRGVNDLYHRVNNDSSADAQKIKYYLDKLNENREQKGEITAHTSDLRSITGRITTHDFNLQNLPKRIKYANELRDCIIIDDLGHQWIKFDFSQMEFRMLAHYAMGPGSDELREKYKYYLKTDYHDLVSEIAGCTREEAKTINFALMYGAGKNALIELGYDEGLYNKYHESLPFVKYTFDKAMSVAKTRGYIKTLGNRRINVGNDDSYKALNYVIQGSCVDYFKEVMIQSEIRGLFKLIGYPKFVVHDEYNFSTSYLYNKKYLLEFKDIMERDVANKYYLKVPMLANMEVKACSYGEPDAKEIFDEIV